MHDLYPDVLIMAGMLKPHSLAGESDARPERADVSRARRRRHHRPRYRKTAAALSRNDPRQDPLHSELGDACARRSRGRSGQSVSPSAFRPLRRRSVRQSRLYPRSRHRIRGRATAARQPGYSLPAVGLGDRIRSVARRCSPRQGFRTSPWSIASRTTSSRRFFRPPTSGSFPTAGTSPAYRCPAGSTICWPIGRPVILVSEARCRGGADGDRA